MAATSGIDSTTASAPAIAGTPSVLFTTQAAPLFLVVGNHDSSAFSAGANIFLVLMAANNKDWAGLGQMIEQLQGLSSVQEFKALHPALDLNALRMVVYAAVLIGLMILRPEGLFGERELFRRVRKAMTRGFDGGDPQTPGPAGKAGPS